MSSPSPDTMRRLADAQRELHDLAGALFNARTSKGETRREQGRRLNAIAASLRTVELALGKRQARAFVLDAERTARMLDELPPMMLDDEQGGPA